MKSVRLYLIFSLIGILFCSCAKDLVTKPVYDLVVKVSPSEGGIVNPTSGKYEEGQQIDLSATPNNNFYFEGWEGDVLSTSNPLSITITSNKTITAKFKNLSLKSIEVVNPLTSIVISQKYKFKINGRMTNNSLRDLSNEVKIISKRNRISVLPDNSLVGVKSGVDTLEITKDNTTTLIPLNVRHFEFVDIPVELTKNNGATIQVPVIILSYIPTENGVDLDLKQGPDGYHQIHNSSIERVKNKIYNESVMAKKIWEEGSRFRNFNTKNSPHQLNIVPVAYVNVYEMDFIQTATNREVDYKKLFDRIGLSDLINSKNVKEIWFNHFPLYNTPAVSNNKNLYPNTKLFWGLDESNMSSPTTPDISNSSRKNDLPILNHTYVVYAFNQSMGISNHVHCRGHQLEVQLSYIENKVIYPPANNIENTIFWGKFVGMTNNNGGWDFKPGRVGRTHNPPNTYDNEQYQYSNSRKFSSDIKDWNPDGGRKEEIDRFTWNNLTYDFDFTTYQGFGAQSSTSEVKWLLFMFQSIPGNQNNIKFNFRGSQKTISNWWDVFYNWDNAVKTNKTLWEN